MKLITATHLQMRYHESSPYQHPRLSVVLWKKKIDLDHETENNSDLQSNMYRRLDNYEAQSWNHRPCFRQSALISYYRRDENARMADIVALCDRTLVRWPCKCCRCNIFASSLEREPQINSRKLFWSAEPGWKFVEFVAIKYTSVVELNRN